jgi:hypothetical protein
MSRGRCVPPASTLTSAAPKWSATSLEGGTAGRSRLNLVYISPNTMIWCWHNGDRFLSVGEAESAARAWVEGFPARFVLSCDIGYGHRAPRLPGEGESWTKRPGLISTR